MCNRSLSQAFVLNAEVVRTCLESATDHYRPDAMAFFSLSMVLSLAALTAAETSFSTSHAQLEAKMILYTNSSWHLGGFCLDQAGEGTTKAAEIHARVEWEGTKSLGETGPVMLVAFDAREERWGAVKDSWGQMPCEEKLQAATMSRQLGGAHSYDDFFFRINVHQSSAMRDWHFAVLTCGATERAQFSLTLQARSLSSGASPAV